MSYIPPNFNLIYQNPELPYLQQFNKTVYDQNVPVQTTISFGDFYALMPSDNASPIAVGSSVEFPRINTVSGTDISGSNSIFTLGPIGVYQVSFQVGVTDVSGCQLGLALNGTLLPGSVVGTLGSNSINGVTLVTTTIVNSTLSVINPTGNARSIIVTANLGGVQAVAAHLVITRLR